MAQKLTATSLANEAHSKLCSVQKNFCLQPTENSLRYPGSRGFIFVLIANLCFEESTQNISLLLPANVFVSVFFSKEEKMFSATSLTGNWILKSLNIPTGPLSWTKKTLTNEIWNVASISSSKWDVIISPSKRSQRVRSNQNKQCEMPHWKWQKDFKRNEWKKYFALTPYKLVITHFHEEKWSNET